MKSALLGAMLALSASATAFSAPRFICNQYDRETEKILQNTVVLEPMASGELVEGVAMKYHLSSYKGADVVEEWDSYGTVRQDDVTLNFTSWDKNVKFQIFLDELNESSLDRKDKETQDYICR